VANLLGLKPGNVTINMTFLGGGFGRRGTNDFVIQAVLASRAAGRPVKVIWSREEDMQHDQYRHGLSCAGWRLASNDLFQQHICSGMFHRRNCRYCQPGTLRISP
jgi:xanthine dehydrogenase molybdopterin-binding subunit B